MKTNTWKIFEPSKRKNHRGKIEIMNDILDISTKGIKKTHVMFQANLCHGQMTYYLEELEEKGLLAREIDEGLIIYRTTEKGRLFLDCFMHMLELMHKEDAKVHERYAGNYASNINDLDDVPLLNAAEALKS